MWATLALAAVLQPIPAQGGKLAIKNDRVTYGILGQERKDAKMLPGDVYVVTFDIEGLAVNNADGKVLYSMGMTLKNAEGKVQFQKSQNPAGAITSRVIASFEGRLLNTSCRTAHTSATTVICQRGRKPAISMMGKRYKNPMEM